MAGSLVALCGFSLFAGFVDAAVGGGGLVQLPALFVFLPQAAIPTLLGTNKLASIAGTAIAMVEYQKSVAIPWEGLVWGAIAAFLGSLAGASVTNQLSSQVLRPVVLVVLVGITLYTFNHQELGKIHQPKLARPTLALTLIGLGLGFYDGFLGPGTGSLLNFALVSILGFGFLTATASSKVINFATNLAALIYFVSHGHLLYGVALPMAICNIFGAILGSRTAIAQGSQFIRQLFLIVVSGLILKMAYDLLAS
ncbi:MAG: TSUP family transporter [Pseudanabaenaceae cyanobacterium bins.68]|nr:TSUP family transporter [Pseudanabaenaceae cyanobacterium bins.68]